MCRCSQNQWRFHQFSTETSKIIRNIRKHPPQSPVNEVLLCYFDNIDEDAVSKTSSLTKGADGASQLDAMQYHHLLSSGKYKVKNKEVRTRIAILAGKLATETLNPLTLEAYVSCGLIPQDKNPGLFWLMCGEVLHRIVGKFIGLVLKKNMQIAAGPLQTATGLQSGSETAIHSIRCMFEDDRTDAVILVDVRNAFNSLNCQEALHNVWVLCPQIAIILVNIYSRPAHLIIPGASDIYSLKGTTLGDNAEVRKVCLADDISSSGSLEDLLW